MFVSGHPGRTNRHNTLAELEYLRDVGTSLRWLAGQKLPELCDAHFWYSGPMRLDGIVEKIRMNRTASGGEGDENDEKSSH